VAFVGAAAVWFGGRKDESAFSSRVSAAALADRAGAWAYPLFVGGALVAGAVWAQQSGGAWWSGTPAQAATLGAALLGAAYWIVRRLPAGRGFPAAALAALTFATALFSLFADLVQT
jgi:ABC-type transport system involved in cytochrome c biogenesis permease subunit